MGSGAAGTPEGCSAELRSAATPTPAPVANSAVSRLEQRPSLRHDPFAMEKQPGSTASQPSPQDLLADESRAEVLSRLKARFRHIPAEVSRSAELLRERRLEAEREG